MLNSSWHNLHNSREYKQASLRCQTVLSLRMNIFLWDVCSLSPTGISPTFSDKIERRSYFLESLHMLGVFERLWAKTSSLDPLVQNQWRMVKMGGDLYGLPYKKKWVI